MRCVYKGKATFLSDSLMFLKASSVRVFFPGSVMNRPKKKKTIDRLGSQPELYLAAVKFDNPEVCLCSHYFIQTNVKVK